MTLNKIKKSAIINVLFLCFCSCEMVIEENEFLENKSSNDSETKIESGFYRKWLFSDLTRDTIVLKPIDLAIYNCGYLTFKPDGSIQYDFHVENPPALSCGNSFQLDTSSTWKNEEKLNEIILKLNGQFEVGNSFQMKKLYKVDSTENDKLILIEVKTLYDKRFNMY